MSLIALHNGGGVGIGKSINGGFGLVLDGSAKVDAVIGMAMPWDVMGGVARRSWARNGHAMEVCAEYNQEHADLGHITLPYTVDDALMEKVLK
jgi:urocanate hydratase